MTDAFSLFAAYGDDPTPDVPTVDRDLPDGVYLDLDPQVYFAQRDRLGSSDVQTLHQKREGWWWQSAYNPLRPADTSTQAQNYGSALHVIMLEGVDTYERRFMVCPGKADYPGLLTSAEQIADAIKAAGVTLQGTSKFKKADWNREARVYIPSAPVWDNIWSDFEGAAKLPDGSMRPHVTTTEDATLRIMLDAALDASTPEGAEIAGLLADPHHPPLAEVTVLWTDPQGRRRRGRLDRLWPKFTLDLKSLRGHWNGRELAVTADDMIKKHGYDIQRADHHEARRYLYAFVQMGMENVHGGTAEQRAWLATFPDAAPRWDYVWLFYQKPDMAAGDAPVIFPVWDDHASAYHVHGLRKQQRALDFYTAQVDRFGLEKPWSRVMGIHYTSESYEPHILTYPDNHPACREPVDNENALLGG
jgi:hypothetical protein